MCIYTWWLPKTKLLYNPPLIPFTVSPAHCLKSLENSLRQLLSLELGNHEDQKPPSRRCQSCLHWSGCTNSGNFTRSFGSGLVIKTCYSKKKSEIKSAVKHWGINLELKSKRGVIWSLCHFFPIFSRLGWPRDPKLYQTNTSPIPYILWPRSRLPKECFHESLPDVSIKILTQIHTSSCHIPSRKHPIFALTNPKNPEVNQTSPFNLAISEALFASEYKNEGVEGWFSRRLMLDRPAS